MGWKELRNTNHFWCYQKGIYFLYGWRYDNSVGCSWTLSKLIDGDETEIAVNEEVPVDVFKAKSWANGIISDINSI